MNEQILSEIKEINDKIDVILDILKKNGIRGSNVSDKPHSNNLKAEIQEKLARTRREIELKFPQPALTNVI